MKNNKGITLIALVITIIVLLILAGVSIAMLTGDNGILTQAGRAKYTQIEGQVREEINLAVQAAKMFAEQKSVTSTSGGWLAGGNIGATSTADNTGTAPETVIGQLRQDLTTGKGYTKIEATTTNPTPGRGTVTITYDTDSYSSATNYTDAKIVAVIGVSGHTFTVNCITAYTSGDNASGESIL